MQVDSDLEQNNRMATEHVVHVQDECAADSCSLAAESSALALVGTAALPLAQRLPPPPALPCHSLSNRSGKSGSKLGVVRV